MQTTNQSNETYNCNFCSVYVLKQSLEVHQIKCLGKNQKFQTQIQEQQQSSTFQTLEQFSTSSNLINQSTILNTQSKQQNERLQFPNQNNIQQNQINIFTTQVFQTLNQFNGNQNNQFNVSQQFERQGGDSANIFTQNQNAFSQNIIEQFPQSQNNVANQIKQQQLFNNNAPSQPNQFFFLNRNVQNQQQQQQQINFRIDQTQQIQSRQNPFINDQMRIGQIFPPQRSELIRAIQNNNIILTQNQIESNRTNNSFQFNTPSYFNAINQAQLNDKQSQKQGSTLQYDMEGLNNFDLLKEYTDEEVNLMNDEQFYQYFIHKQIQENHKNETDSQILKIRAEQQLHEEENQCVICQDIIENEDDTKTLGCNHKFHINCISDWLNRKSVCPICKSRIKMNELYY
ncbi:unnamed protein product [Paramecium sonneborni]|uniref:RING-type E3 ubiquitin transferase n=1 Tax=Paramecium sonneborni TaxID=65129 RepID=A0A8S1KSR9_9CILI|nr:unnamed protein product [Paramecium sonneborni]